MIVISKETLEQIKFNLSHLKEQIKDLELAHRALTDRIVTLTFKLDEHLIVEH